MRRKNPVNELTNAEVSTQSLRPAPVDDLSLSYEERKAVMDAWLDERDEWRKRRERYQAVHGWPGGEYERLREEDAAHRAPDYPFNPDLEDDL